jgi:hypothetical protein
MDDAEDPTLERSYHNAGSRLHLESSTGGNCLPSLFTSTGNAVVAIVDRRIAG